MEIIEFIKSIQESDFSDSYGECKMSVGETSNDEDIEIVEKDLGVKLPQDYKKFIKTFGDADFFGVQIRAPFELYRYDSDTLEMEGFIAFTRDASGSNFAFDRNIKIVKCSHDPFGYGNISKTFTEWAMIHFDMIQKLSNGIEDSEHQYIQADKEIHVSWLRMKNELKSMEPKKWWQFWK